MKPIRFLTLFFTALALAANFSCSTVSKTPLTEAQLETKLREHISTLASDAYEGREAGSAGEIKARDYIVKSFKSAGLKPKGEKGFLQPFTFTAGATFGPGTQLYVNNYSFKVNDDFTPLPYSGNGVITGYVARLGYGIDDNKLGREDYKGKLNIVKKIFVMESGTPDGANPHGKFGEWSDLRKKLDIAIQRGATAVIFINSDTAQADPKADFDHRVSPVSIPVLFAKGKAAELLRDSIVTNCTVGAEVIKVTKDAYNVCGYIDNGAATTVVIGAHYDHLGYGHEGSLYRGEPAIHNGADDNASGTAALIELGRDLRIRGPKHNNYLLLAFSGEEKGLLGSNYYVKHPTVDLTKVNYMLNMDMVGRLKKDEPVLILSGTGTSPRWKTLVDSIETDQVEIKATESGVGPSDHTSFYLQNIPVLHFFSGTHADYHKPSDDEDKINYPGALAIIGMIRKTIALADGSGKLVFTKTKDESNEDAPKFKVTLGVVPDYAFDGEGMRIDGVSDGKPAQKAGLLAGDVVVQIGDYKVVDMMSYMKALGKFTKGETTTVKVKRGAEMLEKSITF